MEILVPLLSFIGALGGGYFVWFFKREDERYIKLYGPLKFKLKMMELMMNNQKEIIEEIKEWNINTKLDLMQKHMSPLGKRWLEYRDEIRNLFEQNPGLITDEDFKLISDFMDGCIKRDIIEDGKNLLATNDNFREKLLTSIKNLQDKLL